MKNEKFLSISVNLKNKKDILEKISLYIDRPGQFFHIVSLNPENMVVAQHNTEFSNTLSESEIQLVDGIGVAWGCSILGISPHERISGSDFMDTILQTLYTRSLRVLIIGGRENLAERVAECYQEKFSPSKFKGIMGIIDIKHPTKEEERKIFTIVADYKPQIIYAAFGSPDQELWFWRHKDELKGIICMGVGGGLDFAGGVVHRAPKVIRYVGMEWLFRLIIQPWRWKRQLRLIEFIYLVIKQKLYGKSYSARS